MTNEEREALEVVTSDLEAEINDRYGSTKDHPAMRRRYDRDMEPVLIARKALGTQEPDGTT